MDENVEKTEIANFKPDSFYVFVRETKVEKKHTVQLRQKWPLDTRQKWVDSPCFEK